MRENDPFFWGVSTSAHQVEGGTVNDWTEWEEGRAEAASVSARARKWPEYILRSFPSPIEPDNYRSRNAAEHFSRFRSDVELMARLGVNAHRFSIEWSRIEPQEGEFNKDAIAHYREVIMLLRERNIEPFVTLWHWTHPIWFQEKGGWESPDAVSTFLKYVETIAKEFNGLVTYWIPLNEAGMWAADAYLFGRHPPGERSIAALVRVYFTLIRAHGRAYRMLKSVNSANEVGIAESMEYMAHALLRPLFDYFRNFFFVRRVARDLDFIGVNYYKRVCLWGIGKNTSDMGWNIYPDGIGYFLRKLSLFKKPIYITENGIADARDHRRADFLRQHIGEVIRARGAGVTVRGYFHWSLLDNFEWNEGFWPRFGLFEVDYKTQERRMRESARVYKEIIEGFNV